MPWIPLHGTYNSFSTAVLQTARQTLENQAGKTVPHLPWLASTRSTCPENPDHMNLQPLTYDWTRQDNARTRCHSREPVPCFTMAFLCKVRQDLGSQSRLLGVWLGIVFYLLQRWPRSIKFFNDVGKGNTYPLLVGVQPSPATMKISVVDSQEARNLSTSRSSKTIFRYIPKYRNICWFMFIAALFIIAGHRKQPRCQQTDEWILKMWYL